MFRQVRNAAGIHMSTFKDKSSDDAVKGRDDAGSGDSEVDKLADMNISNWTAPAHVLAQLRKAV